MSRPSSTTGSRLAFAFPGVGVKLCGHEAGFVRQHRAHMTTLLAAGSSYAGYDFFALAQGVEPEGWELPTELQGQLFTYTFNCAVADAYRASGLRPSVMAGHSMGLYSALRAAHVISFADGLAIVERAYHLVTEASVGLESGMAVIVGLARPEIDELLGERAPDDSVQLVNSNNETTKVFSGLTADLESFLDSALQRDALRALLLPVSAPYHHRGFLAQASREFEQYLRGFSWSDADCPIISSLDQRLLTNAGELRAFTAANLSSPIDWERVILAMIGQRAELILECGAGLSLTQNARFVADCPPFANVKNAKRRLGL